MAEYTANIDMGDGGATTIQAADLADATRQAVAWAQAGEWREDGEVIVRVSGPDGEDSRRVAVAAK